MTEISGNAFLRATTPADAPTVVALTQAAYQRNQERTGLYGYVYEENAELLANQMASGGWQIFLLEEAGEPVGCVRLSFADPAAIGLSRLAVRPGQQGRGIGTRIIAAVEQWAAAWGRRWVVLGALEASPENQALYERLGYAVFSRKEMSSAPGNYYALMRKAIAPPPDATARHTATIARYEEIAEHYQRQRSAVDDWLYAVRDRFAAALPAREATRGRPARILEIGCGPGRDAAMLRDAGYAVLALDRTTAMLRLARASGAPLIQGDSRALPARDESVDGAWANASLLHLGRNELVIALWEIRRVLRPGGAFYASFKRGEGEGEFNGRWFGYYQPAELERLIAGAGLELLDLGEQPDNRPGFPSWIQILARKPGGALPATEASETADAEADEVTSV